MANNLSYVSDILASESFNDKMQWDHRGDVDINKDDIKPGSSTPNKPLIRSGISTPPKAGRGFQTKPDTPHTNTGELNTTLNLNSPEVIPVRPVHVLVLTDMTTDTEDVHNKNKIISKNLVSELSFDEGSGSSKTTPDTVRAKKRPAGSPEVLKVSGESNTESIFSTIRCSNQKILKLRNTTPLNEIRRIKINKQNPTSYELLFIQKSLAIIVKVKEGLYDRGLFYYTQLSNGNTYVKGPEINLLKIGNKLNIRPDPNNINEVTLGLSRIFEEPKDDDIIDHSSIFNSDPNSSNIGQSCEESLAIHCSINSQLNKTGHTSNKLANKSKRNKLKLNKHVHTDAEYPGGISTFNRYEALNQVCTDLRPLPVDSDNFDDGDYRSDSNSHGESSVPVIDIPDIAVSTERKNTCGKGGKFFRHNSHMESSDSEPEGCENKVKLKTQLNRNTFLKTSEVKIPQRRKTKLNSTKDKTTCRKTSQVEITDDFPSLPSRNDHLTNNNLKFYTKSQPTIPKSMMGNRASSTTPSQSQTPFTVISNKKSARADNIALSDPLRKVVKVMRKLIWEQDILDDIRKENPALNIKSVTTWNNNFLDIGLHEITEVDSISIQNNLYPLFPYVISPTKCGYCQKWGHPTKNCQSTKPPVCHQCSLSHPRRNSPCVSQTKCSNCRGNHPTHDKVCSAYKKALQILANKSKNPLVSKPIIPLNPKNVQSSNNNIQHQNPQKDVTIPIKYTRNTKLNGKTPVVLSDLTNILIGVLLSGGSNGDYDCEPNLPQLTRATYNICDVIEHTLGVSIPREEILGVACSRYKLDLPFSTGEKGVGGNVYAQDKSSMVVVNNQ